MASNPSQPNNNAGTTPGAQSTPGDILPQITSTVEQNVKPVVTEAQRVVEQNVKPAVTEAQRVAAQTSFSGRKAVSRGTMFLAFYIWLLLGAMMFSFIARYTDFFPGYMPIKKALQ